MQNRKSSHVVNLSLW